MKFDLGRAVPGMDNPFDSNIQAVSASTTDGIVFIEESSDIFQTTDISYCHDCGAAEGELHEFGCDMERCPFCFGQLITCRCFATKLRISTTWEQLTDTQIAKWECLAERKGRIRYFRLLHRCARCGSTAAWYSLQGFSKKPFWLCQECSDMFRGSA